MKLYYLFLLTFFMSNLYCQSSSFNNKLINSVVLIEKKTSEGFKPHGTGFIFYNYNSNKSFIVTNKHVIGNYSKLYVTIPLSENHIEFNSELFNINIKNSNKWVLSDDNLRAEIILNKDSNLILNENYDIAIFELEFPKNLYTEEKTYLFTDLYHIPKSAIAKKDDIDIGNDVYFIGFPFYIGTSSGFYSRGLYSDYKMNPVVRKGIVSWKSKSTEEFLIDGYSFGGNSGSPIFTNKDSNGESKFIGIVFGHLNDFNSTRSTKDIYTYNAGLVTCVWSDEIERTIKNYLLKFK